MNNRFLLILISCIVVLGGIFFITKNNDDTASNSQGTASQHITGKADSKVVLVEYGDFECPACAAYFPIVSQIKTDYKDKIAFQFRHFPLVQIHQNAMASSRAAEAAGKQGKFWEMHDLLYGQQDAWAKSSNATAIFEDYATQLGINVEQFKVDSASSAVLDTINADVGEGQKLNITGTPTFVLNGRVITETPQTYEAFAKILDEEINKQSSAQ